MFARFRGETRATQSVSVMTGDSLRIHQDHHGSRTPKFGFETRLHPCARLVLRDPATTVSRRPPRYRPSSAFPPRPGRKMRPADMCKPELSKTSTRASGAYPACSRDELDRRGALRGSRRHSELWCAAPDDSELCRLVGRRRDSPLALRRLAFQPENGPNHETEIASGVTS